MRHVILSVLILVFISPVICGVTTGGIRLLEINGPITPVTVQYIARNLQEAGTHGDRLVLIEMDTPGGLDSSMRAIVKDIFSSSVPVGVYVAPAGARAASAGAIIALAADFCAMAPGTNIGAAHPVSIGTKPDKVMQEKIMNDMVAYVEGIAEKRGRDKETVRNMVRSSISLPAEEARALKVIDLVAADRQELLRKLDGRVVRRGDRSVTLRTDGIRIEQHAMSARERILDVISNPTIAYLLMMLGFIGIFFELSTPGAILPGVIGGISLILAFFAFQALPVNYAGVLLILLALILFIAEIKIVSQGMLTVGGVIAMTLGSVLLFESSEPFLRVSLSLILTTVALVAAAAIFIVRKAVTAHQRKPSSGREGLIGERGIADTDIMPEGKIFVHGEYWDAWSDEPITRGQKVVIVALEDMKVLVKREDASSVKGG